MSHPLPTVTPMTQHGERCLYATWRNPEGLIRPVGMLTRLQTDEGESYRFVYLKAAEAFGGFRSLPGLDDLHHRYESAHLFPVFRSRQMPRTRPDYVDFVGRLALDEETDPFEVLIRSEGWRATDRIEVFAHPERTPEGDLTTLFFARGIRHIGGAAEAVDDMRAGDGLELVDEPENPVNRRAILLNTRTGRSVGYVPNYLVETIHELRDLGSDVSVTAEHVNPGTAPPHMRLLCRLRAPWPDGYKPLSGPEYQPIAA